MNNQIWKDVVGYQGLYQVSNFGRVKSITFRNRIICFHRQKILKQKISNRIYKCRTYKQHQVQLYKQGSGKFLLVHRLVWQAFNGKIPKNMQIDHINNQPSDNRLDNLQLLTKSENQKKRFKDNPNYKTHFEVINPKRKILCLNNNTIYESIQEAERQLNIANICAVLKGKRKHTKGYIFRYIDDSSIYDKINQIQLF